MDPLLFLVHRIPYPPNKGDKIRSFNLLKQLSLQYRVYLGAFVDDEQDWQYEDTLSKWCEEIFLVRLQPKIQKLISLRGFLTGSALSLPYYYHKGMKSWVGRKLMQGDIDKVLIFSSSMAQYVDDQHNDIAYKVIDFVDVDSEKWRQYSERHSWPMSWVYRREANKLLAEEKVIATRFDRSVFVTEEEANLFRSLAPEVSESVVAISNGVDVEHFSPALCFESPYGVDEAVLAFTGAMDYWANVDAVVWFAQQIFPLLRAAIPNAKFYIVGAHPTEAVRRLSEIVGVIVTGQVDDVRPYLLHSNCVVAPLRVARGIQNKVLEAMSMAKPVIATSFAMDGIHIDEVINEYVADEPREFADLCIFVMNNIATLDVGQRGRELVESNYSWREKLQAFSEIMESPLRSDCAT